jgi:hypothetical protein
LLASLVISLVICLVISLVVCLVVRLVVCLVIRASLRRNGCFARDLIALRLTVFILGAGTGWKDQRGE